MKILKKEYSILFGDQSASYVKHSLKGCTQKELSSKPPFSDFAGMPLVFLNQVHGTKGYCIDTPAAAQIAPYAFDGDYMVTTLLGVALVVETADCVPLVLLDSVKMVAALVHAGWRGAIGGIVTNALHDMFMRGSAPEDIQAFCGPAARGCCYEVGKDFKQLFRETSAFIVRDGRIFFDNVSYITGQLETMGIGKHHIFLNNAACTICSEGYCSYRRQGSLQLRQMTIVALK